MLERHLASFRVHRKARFQSLAFFAMNAGPLNLDSGFGYAFKKLTAYNSKG
jgi:hypothetical protein